MTKDSEGWYYTWFYDKKKHIREYDHPEEPFSGHVFSPKFVHKERDDLEVMIEDLVLGVEESIAAKREDQSVIRTKAKLKKGLSGKERTACNRAAKDIINELEEEIEELKLEQEDWDFFRPSKKHWIYKGEKGTYDLVERRYHNPLVLNVSSTMSFCAHEVVAEILPGLNFKVNASSYDYLLDQLGELDQGARYASLQIHPSFEIIVPSEVIVALKKHPWKKYKKQMKKWEKKRAEFRTGLASDSRFYVNLDG